MLIKEVPVFIQYQSGNKMISASEVLSVSTQAFVDEVVFEDEIGKDGTKRADERLTISELGSGKYYVAFETIKDQYGNELSADDLNYQKDTNKATGATLFIIPGNTGAFYSTGDFGELNGKTILWLRPIGGINGKPGSMPLTITGAGGKTFSKDITIEDNPYIETLNVTYPELYSGSAESAAFEFSAVDQYGETVDLWDFAPSIVGGELWFNDFNRMTTQPTKMTISQGAFNTVVKDAGKKTFKVTADMTGVNAKTLVVFTTTTAGMQVSTQQVTVGEMGTAAKIKSALSGGNTQLDQIAGLTGKNKNLNFNKFIQFEDANGNTMVRGKSEKYPFYVAIQGKNVEETLPISTAAVWTAGTSSYRWSLTDAKVSDTNGAGTTVVPGTTNDYANGVVASGDVPATNTLDVYATVYLFDGVGGTYYKLDDQVFHLTKVAGDEDKSYTVKAGGTIYANADNGNEVEIKVSATTNSGETYDVDPSRIKVTPKAPFAVGSSTNKINGKAASALGSGTTTATVYVDGEQVATVDVPFTTDAPKATKVKLKFDIPAGNTGAGGNEISRVGKEFDGDLAVDSFKLAAGAGMTVEGGKLTIAGANALGDTITAFIEDQYGNAMSNTVFYVDGSKVTKNTPVNTATADVTIEYTNGTLAGRFILEKGGANVVLNYPQTLSRTVTNDTSLRAALNDAAVSEVIVDYDIDGVNTHFPQNADPAHVIPAGKTVIINSGKKFKAEVDVKVNGTLKVNGSLEIPAAQTLTNTGKIVINGDVTSSDKIVNTGAEIVVDGFWDIAFNGGTINNTNGSVTGSGHVTLTGGVIAINNGATGVWRIDGTSTAIAAGAAVTFNGGEVGGHIEIANTAVLTVNGSTLGGDVDVDGTLNLQGSATLADGLVIDATEATAIATTATLNMAAGSTVTLLAKDGSTQTLTTETAGADDVQISASKATSSKAVVESGQRTMAAVTVTTNDSDAKGTLTTDALAGLYKTTGTLTRDSGVWDAETKTMTYTYTYDGVLAYGGAQAASALGYKESDAVYALALSIPTVKATGCAKLTVGDNFKAGTVAPSAGVMTWPAGYEACSVWAPGFLTAGDKDFNMTYTFEDGSKVIHAFHLTADNFEAKTTGE